MPARCDLIEAYQHFCGFFFFVISFLLQPGFDNTSKHDEQDNEWLAGAISRTDCLCLPFKEYNYDNFKGFYDEVASLIARDLHLWNIQVPFYAFTQRNNSNILTSQVSEIRC